MKFEVHDHSIKKFKAHTVFSRRKFPAKSKHLLPCGQYALINKYCLQSWRISNVADWFIAGAELPVDRVVPLIIFRNGQRCLV